MSNPDSSQVHSVKIFPPIGIARLGDSGFNLGTGKEEGKIEYFIPSEIPGTEDVPAELGGQFRDSNNRIKRQAVRFRVYAYDKAGTILGEITHDEKYKLTWTVHVANAKGSFHLLRAITQAPPEPEPLRNPDVQPGLEPDKRTKLIVDSGEQSISGTSATAVDLAGKFQGSKETSVDVGLGQLRTDDKGRLVFVPAPGYSRSVADPTKPQPDIESKFDNIDWVDDTCDGWVNVKVEFGEKNWDAKDSKATIISAPPKFAWGMHAPTSLYDLIEDIYWVKEGKPNRKTEFYQDIWPVLRGTYLLSWTNKKAAEGHGPTGRGRGNFLPHEVQLKDPSADSQYRKKIFDRLRKPNYEDPKQATPYFMPRLSGNSGDMPQDRGDITNFAALTELQYEHFKKWSEGTFINGPAPWENIKKFEDVPKDLQPLFLTRAALEHTIGEALYPGIEAYWVMKKEDTYKPHSQDPSQDPPFRINYDVIKPGHLGRGLSLPWQTDFKLCHTDWWPSVRPDDVLRKANWGTEKKISVEIFSRDHDQKLRIKWDRITNSDNGLTDMVRLWQRLGFVSKHQDYAVTKETLEMPVWLEEEELI